MRKLDAIALLPFATLIALAALFLILRAELHVADAPIEKLRLIWGATAYGVVAALIWNALLAGYALYSILSKEGPHVRWIIALGTLAMSGSAICVVWFIQPSGELASDLLKSIELHTKVDVQRLTRHENILGCLTVCLLVASLSALSIPRRLETVEELAHTIRLWLLSLYSGAILLAFAVLEVWSLFRWGASLALTAELRASSAEVADGIALTAAVVFSVMLASMYLPVAALHTSFLNRAVAARARIEDNLDVEKWLARHGIKSSPVSVGTAVVLPAIAFLLTTLIKWALQSAA